MTRHQHLQKLIRELETEYKVVLDAQDLASIRRVFDTGFSAAVEKCAEIAADMNGGGWDYGTSFGIEQAIRLLNRKLNGEGS